MLIFKKVLPVLIRTHTVGFVGPVVGDKVGDKVRLFVGVAVGGVEGGGVELSLRPLELGT